MGLKPSPNSKNQNHPLYTLSGAEFFRYIRENGLSTGHFTSIQFREIMEEKIAKLDQQKRQQQNHTINPDKPEAA